MAKLTGKTIGVIGLGQIGGSICASLKAQSAEFQIDGFDLNETLQKAALEHQIIDKTTLSINSLLDRVDIVVLATPIESILNLIQSYENELRAKHLVMDTGSLKEDVMNTASKLGLTNFIGGHPIAGTEKSGSDSWDQNLFHSAPFLFATTPETNSDALIAFRELMKLLQTNPVPVDPQEHDCLFAVTIGLPHLLALTLRQQFDDISLNSFDKTYLTGPSFRGITRVADSTPELIQQMLWINRNNLNSSLKRLIDLLKKFSDSIDDNDIEYLNDLLTKINGSQK